MPLLRRTLAAAEDHSVVIIQVGIAANLADLLRSPPDAISPLAGQQLVEKKCRLASVMAGCFEPQPNGRDRYLILSDEQIPRVVATQRALASQPPSSRGPTRTP